MGSQVTNFHWIALIFGVKLKKNMRSIVLSDDFSKPNTLACLLAF